METQACVQLQHSLTRLDEIEATIRILQEKLITEEASALPDIENKLRAYAFDIKAEERQIRIYVETLEKANKEKSPDEIDALLKNLGSPASLDRSFEGGVVSLNITSELRVQLQNYTTAIEALKQADATTVTIGSNIEKISKLPDVWTIITKDTLDILVVNHLVGIEKTNVTTEEERDILTEKMDSLGYRPLELSELMALGITHPQYQETRDEYLNSMKKYTLGAGVLIPYLFRFGDVRGLDTFWLDVEWFDWFRFLFLRK